VSLFVFALVFASALVLGALVFFFCLYRAGAGLILGTVKLSVLMFLSFCGEAASYPKKHLVVVD
jgi:hypothetical protein